jgi:hypothetical protein
MENYGFKDKFEFDEKTNSNRIMYKDSANGFAMIFSKESKQGDFVLALADESTVYPIAADGFRWQDWGADYYFAGRNYAFLENIDIAYNMSQMGMLKVMGITRYSDWAYGKGGVIE